MRSAFPGSRTTVALVVFLATLTLSARAQFTLEQISVDKFKNADSAHRTEVEPDSFAWGNM